MQQSNISVIVWYHVQSNLSIQQILVISKFLLAIMKHDRDIRRVSCTDTGLLGIRMFNIQLSHSSKESSGDIPQGLIYSSHLLAAFPETCYNDTVQSRYKTANLLAIITINVPYLTLQGKIWGAFCE